MRLERQKAEAMATHNPSDISLALRDYADQLEAIRTSISTMARGSGEYKDIVSRLATNVHSTSNVLRSASHVINSMEGQKQYKADRTSRHQARAIRAEA